MDDKDDRAPRRPATSFGPEQGAWSSPAQGIALALALSAVLWLAIALIVRLLWGGWLSGGFGQGELGASRANDT